MTWLVFRGWLQNRSGYHQQPLDEAMHAWLIDRVGRPDPERIVALVAIDVAVSTSDARRRSNFNRTHDLLHARLKQVSRRHKGARRFVEIHPRSR